MPNPKRARHGVLLTLLLMLASGSVWAGAGIWTNTGPFGGNVQTLLVDPTNAATLYAASPYGGVFKSTNGGTNWSAASAGIPTRSVTALAIDPTTPTTLYAAAFSGAGSGILGGTLFKSIDGAQSWTQLPAGGTSPAPTTPSNALAIDPQTPSTIFSAAEGGVFKSTDGGQSWSGAQDGSNGLPSPGNFSAVLVDPHNSSTIYAGSAPGFGGAVGAGVFKSTNGGTSWAAINTGLSGCSFLDVVGLTIDPQNSSTLYAAFSCGSSATGLYKTTNGGASWSQVESGTAGPVAVAASSDATIYVGGSVNGVGSGVLLSSNGGTSFNPVDSGLGAASVNALAISNQSAGTVYAGSSSGVFATTNGGTAWNAANAGLSLMEISALAIDPTAPTTLYAGTGGLGGGFVGNFSPGSGIYKSTDGGSSWTATDSSGLIVFQGLPPDTITALAVDPAAPSTIYAGGNSGNVYRSTTGGASWAESDSGINQTGVAGLVVDPAAPTNVYAAESGGIYKSTDGGSSWTLSVNGLPSGAGFRSLALLPEAASGLPGSVLLANSPNNGLYLSGDGAASWTAFDTSLPASSGTARPALNGEQAACILQFQAANFAMALLFTGGTKAAEIWVECVSPDAEVTGTNTISINGYTYTVPISALLDLPFAAPRVAAGVTVTDFAMPDGAYAGACDPLQTVVGDPVTPGGFYTAGGCGVLRGTNSGAQMVAMNLGLPLNLPISVLAITPSGSDLYAGSQGGGVYRFTVAASPIAAAVLPASRSVEIGGIATAFATMINAGTSTASGCGLALATPLPAGFSYQTTAPGTNAPTGSPNTPVAIPAGAAQTFLFSLDPVAEIDPIDAQLAFTCDGTPPAAALAGIDTLLVSASPTPVPDVVALAATPSGDGIVDLPGNTGANAFAVATVNLGASGPLTVAPRLTSASLPVALSICQTDPVTGQCQGTAAASVSTTIAAGTTPTFAIFVGGAGAVPFDPVNNRIVVQFTDSGGAVRGATSVALRTQ